jgi:hypothetical protein
MESIEPARKPNRQLRCQREMRGWSRARMVEALLELYPDIPLDEKTVARWETGKRVPGPYYREKLVKLFGVSSVEQLGLIVSSEQPSAVDNEPDDAFKGESSVGLLTPLQQEEKSVHLVALTDEQIQSIRHFFEDEVTVAFDPSKRVVLKKIARAFGSAAIGAQLLDDIEFWTPAEAHHAPKADLSDLDLIDGHLDALQILLAKGETQYVMHSTQNLYSRLVKERPYSKDIHLTGTQLRIGMLLGAAQEYALPWYQRDQAVVQTYNHVEDNIISRFNGTLQHEYARLLAKRGRQYRVLWQFEECIRECEQGLQLLEGIDDPSLLTHFLCERAHIEATKGDEFLWMRKLEEAKQGMLGMRPTDREKALNQADYMQGEGFKRLAFHTQRDLPMPLREKYARYALNHFSRWQGVTIELPGFEDMVVQVSRAQCLVLVDPDEAIMLAKHIGKQAEQGYLALLDKIHRVIFLAEQRRQMGTVDFSQIFRDAAQSPYKAGRNIL